MTDPSQVGVVRAACARDQAAIQALQSGFRRESVRPLTTLQKILLSALAGLLGAIAIHAVLTMSIVGLWWLRQVLHQAAMLGVLIGFSLLAGRFFNQDWRYYWVLEHYGEVIACARLRSYDDYAVLTNLIVAIAHRRQGHGSRLVQAIANPAKRPLYLSCMPQILPLYTRLGFKPVSPVELSTALKYDLNLLSQAEVIPLRLTEQSEYTR